MDQKKTSIKELSCFYQAVTLLNNESECQAFFEDICTIHELHSISQRLEVARLLKKGMTFNDIVAATGASTATISRVNRCLLYGTGGYQAGWEKLKSSDEANQS